MARRSVGSLLQRITSLAGLLAALCAAALTACGGDGESGEGGSGPTSTGPWVLVPPEPLGGDPATACPGAYATTAPVQGPNGSFEVAGQSRNFHLLLPDASHAGPHPLFVALNGTGENGLDFVERAQLQDFAARGFIVAAPSSNGNGTIYPVWDAMHGPSEPDDANPDLAFFDALVACLGAHLSVDRHRIYVGGHSAGGIMTNYLLQRRSSLLAGGIPASGVFSLTSPAETAPLDGLVALVTWGGDNDAWSGSAGGVQIPEINFVEQASIASQFYDDEPAVDQANCHGADQGHVWLSEINDWMVDLLLSRPKGLAGSAPLDIPEHPGGQVTCTAEPYLYEGGISVLCPTGSSVAHCDTTCQFVADCVVENSTVGPILEPQLSSLGFSGADNGECTGCVTHCEDTASSAADAEVLGCMAEAADSATCGPGIDGALPAIDAINACCEGRSDSDWCLDTCAILLGNTATQSFLASCVDLVGTN